MANTQLNSYSDVKIIYGQEERSFASGYGGLNEKLY